MEAWQDLTQPLTCANSYAQDQEGIFFPPFPSPCRPVTLGLQCFPEVEKEELEHGNGLSRGTRVYLHTH